MSAYLEPLAAGKKGRPPKVTVTAAEAVALRRAYIRSNRARQAGSMAGAALHTACDPAARLSGAVAEAIRDARRANRALPVEVRRALRASQAAVATYRDPQALKLGGIHAKGCMRMARDADGALRRLRPGERWSVDDGSINFCVNVPWPWGGDKCSETFGVRVGRFQLLPAIDDATHCCVGWGYAIRLRDSYRADDVVWTLAGIMRHAYVPESIVIEGGSWQAGRTLEFLNAAGVRWHDAKGRPRSKLIENYFNDLWTVLSLESDGQIGRYRSEMERENDILTRCRAGTLDPRRVFPMLQDGLNAIQRAVDFKNAKDVHSDIYGSWVPMEQHQAGMAARPLPALAPGLEFLAARERHERVVRNFGQITARAMSPLGDSHPYSFAGDALTAWNGARVWVHFDPFAAPVVATVTLAKRFRDTPAGTVIARDLRCLTDAPELIRDSRGWRIEFADGLAEAARAKRLAGAVVRRELRVASLDGARVAAESTVSAPEGIDRQAGIGRGAMPNLDATRAARAAIRDDVDLAELEAFERQHALAM
jgi:hypothetical protein